MPCWENRTIKLDFSAANRELLLQSLEALGFKYFQAEHYYATQNRAAMLTREEALAAPSFVAYTNDPRIYTQQPGGTAIFQDGKLEVRGYTEARAQAMAGDIQRSYAAAAVKYAAKRYGFTVQQDKNNAAKMTLQRRF